MCLLYVIVDMIILQPKTILIVADLVSVCWGVGWLREVGAEVGGHTMLCGEMMIAYCKGVRVQ